MACSSCCARRSSAFARATASLERARAGSLRTSQAGGSSLPTETRDGRPGADRRMAAPVPAGSMAVRGRAGDARASSRKGDPRDTVEGRWKRDRPPSRRSLTGLLQGSGREESRRANGQNRRGSHAPAGGVRAITGARSMAARGRETGAGMVMRNRETRLPAPGVPTLRDSAAVPSRPGCDARGDRADRGAHVSRVPARDCIDLAKIGPGRNPTEPMTPPEQGFGTSGLRGRGPSAPRIRREAASARDMAPRVAPLPEPTAPPDRPCRARDPQRVSPADSSRAPAGRRAHARGPRRRVSPALARGSGFGRIGGARFRGGRGGTRRTGPERTARNPPGRRARRGQARASRSRADLDGDAARSVIRIRRSSAATPPRRPLAALTTRARERLERAPVPLRGQARREDPAELARRSRRQRRTSATELRGPRGAEARLSRAPQGDPGSRASERETAATRRPSRPSRACEASASEPPKKSRGGHRA